MTLLPLQLFSPAVLWGIVFYICLFTYSAVGTVPMTAPVRENTCKSETLCPLGWKLIVHPHGLKAEEFKKNKPEFPKSG